MQSCYADNATFSDPVFPHLDVKQVRAMWEMFCVNSDTLEIECNHVEADDTSASARWRATYTLPATGNKVINTIQASFVLEDGKIISHIDKFSFYNWMKQAFGFTGMLLGWTPFMKNKVRKQAMSTLKKYISRTQTSLEDW